MLSSLMWISFITEDEKVVRMRKIWLGTWKAHAPQSIVQSFLYKNSIQNIQINCLTASEKRWIFDIGL